MGDTAPQSAKTPEVLKLWKHKDVDFVMFRLKEGVIFRKGNDDTLFFQADMFVYRAIAQVTTCEEWHAIGKAPTGIGIDMWLETLQDRYKYKFVIKYGNKDYNFELRTEVLKSILDFLQGKPQILT